MLIEGERAKPCAALVAEEAAQPSGAGAVGALEHPDHVAVTGASATVYGGRERTLFIYEQGDWRADWAEETS